MIVFVCKVKFGSLTVKSDFRSFEREPDSEWQQILKMEEKMNMYIVELTSDSHYVVLLVHASDKAEAWRRLLADGNIGECLGNKVSIELHKVDPKTPEIADLINNLRSKGDLIKI